MEELFLNKLAEAYQTYDAPIVEDYLADDMHYASMWVFHEMTSKKEYMDYLVGNLQTMKEHGRGRGDSPSGIWNYKTTEFKNRF